MDKKYLILKSSVPKAHGGTSLWGKNLISNRVNARNMKALESAYSADQISAMDFNEQATKGSDLVAKSDSKAAGLIGTAANLVDAGSSMLFENALEKNSKKTGFGDEIVDDKDARLMTGQSAVHGMAKGAGIGASIGSVVPVIGTAAGAIVGGVVGAITGLLGGKKKAKQAQTASQELLAKNIKTQGRTLDMQASQGLMSVYGQDNQLVTGKNGIKLNIGHFHIPKVENKTLRMRTGGKLEELGTVNVVLKGTMHRENNNLGNKDKGIPVVDAEGNKEYEVEEGEIIFRKEVTDEMERVAAEYKETNNTELLENLGKYIAYELLNNTQDNYGKYGVKIN